MKPNIKTNGRGLDKLIPNKTISENSSDSEVLAISVANIATAARVLSDATQGMNAEESAKMLALIAETATWMLATGRR